MPPPDFDSVRREALARTRAALEDAPAAPDSPRACVPEALRGSLAEAVAAHVDSSPAAGAPPHHGVGSGTPAHSAAPRVGGVIFRAEHSSAAGVRTLPSVLRVLARELVEAPTIDVAARGAGAVRARLLSTGAYSRVALSTQPSASDAGALDVVVDVAPKSWGLQAGTSQTLSGKIEAGLTVSSFDALGLAETIKLSALTSPGSLSGADVLSAVSSSEPLSSTLSRTGAALAVPGHAYKAEFCVPTLGECAGGLLGRCKSAWHADARHNRMHPTRIAPLLS